MSAVNLLVSKISVQALIDAGPSRQGSLCCCSGVGLAATQHRDSRAEGFKRIEWLREYCISAFHDFQCTLTLTSKSSKPQQEKPEVDDKKSWI